MCCAEHIGPRMVVPLWTTFRNCRVCCGIRLDAPISIRNSHIYVLPLVVTNQAIPERKQTMVYSLQRHIRRVAGAPWGLYAGLGCGHSSNGQAHSPTNGAQSPFAK